METEKPNPVLEKSFAFALRIVKASDYLREHKVHTALVGQLLRCGTSIEANVEEAAGAHSRKEFAAKMSIAYKEAREAAYWIRLMIQSGKFRGKASETLYEDCQELVYMLSAITSTLRKSRSEQ